jgi:hypothetical protein
MKRIVDFLTLLLIGSIIGAAAADLKNAYQSQPHSDIVSFEIKPVTPGSQGI